MTISNEFNQFYLRYLSAIRRWHIYAMRQLHVVLTDPTMENEMNEFSC